MSSDPYAEYGVEPTDEQAPESYAERVARREARLARKANRRAGWAESREAKAAAASNRAARIADGIPLGQPILVGHHSERHARRDAGRIRSAMDQTVEHSKMAKIHADKADAYERALERQYEPGFCYRRIEDGKTELREAERRKARGQSNADDLIAQAKAKITFWEARLAEVGGLKIDLATIEKGDIVITRHGPYEVIRVNKKSVTIKGWFGFDDWTWKFGPDDIKRVVKPGEKPTEAIAA